MGKIVLTEQDFDDARAMVRELEPGAAGALALIGETLEGAAAGWFPPQGAMVREAISVLRIVTAQMEALRQRQEDLYHQTVVLGIRECQLRRPPEAATPVQEVAWSAERDEIRARTAEIWAELSAGSRLAGDLPAHAMHAVSRVAMQEKRLAQEWHEQANRLQHALGVEMPRAAARAVGLPGRRGAEDGW